MPNRSERRQYLRPDLVGRSIACTLALLGGSEGGQAAGPDSSPPALCGSPPNLPLPAQPVSPPNAALLTGSFECVEEGVRLALTLRDDGRYLLVMEPADPSIVDEAEADTPTERDQGRWTLKDGKISAISYEEQDEGDRQRFHPVDVDGQTIVIPAGIGSAVLRRVR